MAFPTGWTRRCAITIPAAKVGTGGVTDFSVLLTEANLPAEIFTVARSDGGDVRFSSDSAGSTQLALDVIRFDAGSSRAVLRVKAPSLSSSSGGTLYAWYGKADETLPAASDSYGQYAAYDASWHAYWPMEGTGNRISATGALAVLSGSPSASAAKVGDGYTTDSGNLLKASGVGDVTGAITVSAWAKPTASTHSGKAASHWGSSAATQQWLLMLNSGKVLFARQNGGTYKLPETAATLAGGSWGWLCGWYDGSDTKASLNNASEATSAGALTAVSYAVDVGIGRQVDDSSSPFTGQLDEIQIHTSGRSAAWRTTEYNQTSDSATFATAGTPETPGGGPDTTSPTITGATIPSAGTTLVLGFSEATTYGAGGTGGATVSATGGALTLTYASGAGTASWTFNTSRTVEQGETVSNLSYTQPGDGWEDAAGNDLASFTGQAVTNNSTQASPPAAPTDLAGSYVEGSGAVLTWAGAGTGATGVGVEVAASSDFAGAVRYNYPVGTTTADPLVQSAGSTYYYRVCYYNSAGDSAWAYNVGATLQYVSVTAPGAAALSVSLGKGTATGNSFTLTATVSGGSSPYSVAFQASADSGSTWTPLGTDASSPYTQAVTASGAVGAVLAYRAVVTDDAEATATSSDTVTHTVVDATAPTPTRATPDGDLVYIDHGEDLALYSDGSPAGDPANLVYTVDDVEVLANETAISGRRVTIKAQSTVSPGAVVKYRGGSSRLADAAGNLVENYDIAVRRRSTAGAVALVIPGMLM